uniref:N/A n=1 Tax=Ganoderma boninense TaxID=34458 RepID=A0A5K1K5G1_9APHY|nr:N/A [Ganoderma boninense]
MESKHKKTRSKSMRRFLRDVLKPTPALSTLGKRERVEDPRNPDNPNSRRVGATSTPSTPSTPVPACIALQNEDPLEDAIVITALSLLTVAAILNAKLPRVLQIDVGPRCSDLAIRYAIELLVGLRDPDHFQPTPTLSTSRFTMVYGTPLCDPGPGHPLSPMPALNRNAMGASPSPSPRAVSPLVRPSRASISLASPALPILHEDAREREPEEGSPSPTFTLNETKPGPPQKKRRTDAPITRALSHRIVPFLASAHADGSARDTDTDSPTPSPRVRARGGIPLARALTIAHGEGPYGQAETGPKNKILRGGTRHVRAKSLKAYMHMTSTPKRYGRAEAAVNSPAAARRFMSLLADMHDQGQTAGGSRGRAGRELEVRARGRRGAKPHIGDTAFMERTADYSCGETTVASVQTEPRADDTAASVSVKVEELDPELTFGLDEMMVPVVAGTGGIIERSDTDVICVV